MTDTIFALSSAPGRAGVAVVRVSGPRAGGALEALAGSLPAPRVARLVSLRDPATGAAIDRALILWFPGPASATGENVAELHLHGGRAVIEGAIEALGALPGLRPAEAGEYTRRAFENGKLDLSEVEGLADLIEAETAAQRRQALRQMGGALSAQADSWRTRLVGALAHLEAAIDFSDEDLPDRLEAEARGDMLAVSREIGAALDDGGRGERLRVGLNVVIIGPPNTGKSSLINALMDRDVAIVSNTAGTTRDVIEAHLDLGGYPLTLFDTAGLRATPYLGAVGDIEEEGIRRARARAAGADLKLAMFDIREAGDPDAATVALLDKDSLVVLNKADLGGAPEGTEIAGHRASILSLATGEGLSALVERLTEMAAVRFEGPGEAPAITRARHRAAFEDTLAALDRALAAPALEMMAEDFRLAIRALARIAGRVDVEEVLDVIFRDFCIGK